MLTPSAKVKGWLQLWCRCPGWCRSARWNCLAFYNDPEAVLVDMREPEWYVKATIPGAVNILYTEVATRLGELVRQGRQGLGLRQGP